MAGKRDRELDSDELEEEARSSSIPRHASATSISGASLPSDPHALQLLIPQLQESQRRVHELQQESQRRERELQQESQRRERELQQQLQDQQQLRQQLEERLLFTSSQLEEA